MDLPPDRKSLDFRRGFFRFWIALAIIWISAVGVTFYQTVWVPRQEATNAQECIAIRTGNPALGSVFDCFYGLTSEAQFSDQIPIWPSAVRFILIGAGAPPVAVGLFLVGSLVLRRCGSGRK